MYIICDEAVILKQQKMCKWESSLGGATVSLIRYADDKAVVASSHKRAAIFDGQY